MVINRPIKGIKINSKEDDGHKDGDECIIIGELDLNNFTVSLPPLYICIFSDFPYPVMTASPRIKLDKELNQLELDQIVVDYINYNYIEVINYIKWY